MKFVSCLSLCCMLHRRINRELNISNHVTRPKLSRVGLRFSFVEFDDNEALTQDSPRPRCTQSLGPGAAPSTRGKKVTKVSQTRNVQ